MQATIDKLQRGEQVTIVALGDSITHTTFHTRGHMSWVQLLEEAIQATYGNNTCTMINAGQCGGNAEEAITRLHRDVIRFSPHLVIIALGMNDACRGLDHLPQFTDNLRQIATTIRHQTGAELLFRTPNPVVTIHGQPLPPEVTGPAQPWEHPGRPLAHFAKAIVKLAAQLDAPCVDHYTLWTTTTFPVPIPSLNPNHLSLRMSDAIHPGPIGHQTFYQEIAPHLNLPTHFPWQL